ncbi:hypothetical protein BH24ACT13_BH24ACT13_12290 [soil metagenome]
MSYDLLFLRRAPGQSWADALAALDTGGGQSDGPGGPLPAEDVERWERLQPRVREMLGRVEELSADDVRELTSDQTGMQLILRPGLLTLSVPFWYEGEAAVDIMRIAYDVGAAIRDETGLEGWDPQLEEPVDVSGKGPAAERAFGRVRDGAAADTEDDDGPTAPWTGASGSAGAGDREPLAPAEETADRPRRWWEFWR